MRALGHRKRKQARLSPATIFACAFLVALLMSTEFLAQPFVWRNWSLEEVMDGWLHIAIDRCLVAGGVAACLVLADRLPTPGRAGKMAALAGAIATGALLGECVRIAVDPFADRGGALAIGARVLQWTLVGAIVGGILASWRLNSDLATTAAETAAGEARLRRLLLSSQLEALQRQIEPHFLFNTLATVRRFGRTAPTEARALLDRLFDYISSMFEATREPLSNLGAEHDLVLAYLDVCAVRMGARLTVVDRIDPNLRAMPFPPLMLATLVENAIRHGLAPAPAGGAIILASEVRPDGLEISVTDDGVGLRGEGGAGIGLANLAARLDILYGPRASLRLEAVKPHGVRATLWLPSGRHAS
jgi:hypothetical protein